MVQKYLFFPLVLFSILGLAFWCSIVESLPSHHNINIIEQSEPLRIMRRREMLETVDRIVSFEHYYHSIYGRFTNSLARLGYYISPDLLKFYKFRVVEASRDHLTVNVTLESDGKIIEYASVDQDYQINSNFELPQPRAEYLKAQALNHLRLLYRLSHGQVAIERGIFKDYFQYFSENDPEGRRFVFALGIKDPVMGVRLDLNSQNLEEFELNSDISDPSSAPHEFQTSSVPSPFNSQFLSIEELSLAQKIFLGEVGRYAKNWEELYGVVHFYFKKKNRMSGHGSHSSIDAYRNPSREEPEASQLKIEMLPFSPKD